jgi:hypothetical protein
MDTDHEKQAHQGGGTVGTGAEVGEQLRVTAQVEEEQGGEEEEEGSDDANGDNE